MHATILGLVLLGAPSSAGAVAPPPSDASAAAPTATPVRTAPPPPTTATPGTSPPRSAAPPPPPPGATRPAVEEPTAVPERVDPVDLSGTWSYARSGTPQPRVVRTTQDIDAVPNPAGYYSGVSIEGNHVPPFPAARMGTRPASMTWTGFERMGDASRVFFEVSADVTTKLDVKPGVVTVRLSNTRINVRNNSRSLDLRYFRTPVRSVKMTRRGRDAVATIVLKHASTPTVSWIAGKAGYRMLVVDFPPAAASDAATE